MDRFDTGLRSGDQVANLDRVGGSTAFLQSKIRDLTIQGLRDGERGGIGQMTGQLLIGDVFRGAARAAPGRMAAALGEESLTFGELDAAANRIARALHPRVGGARVSSWTATTLDSLPLF